MPSLEKREVVPHPLKTEKRGGKTDSWVRLLVRECGMRQSIIFSFSLII
jgi:hypothetical protein